MPNSTLVRSDVIQLLEESGCPQVFTQEFLAAMDTKDVPDQLKLLRTQRMKQLEAVHTEEKKLDRLDFLRYALERELRQEDTPQSKGDIKN